MTIDSQPSNGKGLRALTWRLQPLVAPFGVLMASAVFAAVVHFRDPTTGGNYPTCPFLWATGFYCPGCGTLRATHELTDGNIPAALAYNPVSVVAVFIFAVLWVRWLRRVWLGRGRTLAPGWASRLLVVGILAFWLLRNIPGFEVLAPHAI